MTESGWLPIIVDYLYLNGDKVVDVFAHAKVISSVGDDSEDYYELIIPSHEYFTCYIVKEKIRCFL